jgi:hypothetical protein
MMVRLPGAAKRRRIELRELHWPDDHAWGAGMEVGYFRAPRTLPLILNLLNDQNFSGRENVGSVYLELFSRHMGEGMIEMTHEADHAHAAGYTSTRWQRTWRERMRALEKLGFIKVKAEGNRMFAYVLLAHPTVAVHKLHQAGKIPPAWWDTYRARQIQVAEPTYEAVMSSRTKGSAGEKA